MDPAPPVPWTARLEVRGKNAFYIVSNTRLVLNVPTGAQAGVYGCRVVAETARGILCTLPGVLNQVVHLRPLTPVRCGFVRKGAYLEFAATVLGYENIGQPVMVLSPDRKVEPANRREWHRVPVSLPVTYMGDLAGAPILATTQMQDLSAGGLRLVAHHPLARHNLLSLLIQLGPADTMSARSTVLWCEMRARQLVAGVVFRGLTQTQRQRLAACVRQIEWQLARRDRGEG